MVEAALQQYLSQPASDHVSTLIVEHLTTMQEAYSDHTTHLVGQVTATRQALEAALGQVGTQILGLETAMASLVPLLKRVVEYVEKQPKEAPKPKIASYVELYPELRPPPLPAQPAFVEAGRAPRRRVWAWLFPRKSVV
jgi:hypothetical protein